MSHGDFDVITGPAAPLRPIPPAGLPPTPQQPAPVRPPERQSPSEARQ